MVYIDTSVLTAYYCPEILSKKAEHIMTTNIPGISSLTEVEFFSAISRKIREGGIKKISGDKIIAKFLEHTNAQAYTTLMIKSSHYKLARDWIGQFKTPLRSLDAIHLAIASMENLKLITADKTLAKSAKILGLDVLLLSTH